MHRIINKLTENIAWITKRSPHFKGRGRLIRTANRFMLAAGAQPLVTALMLDGAHMKLDLRSGTEYNSFYTGLYDKDRIGELISVMSASSSGVFLDVGANIGFYTTAISWYFYNNHDSDNTRVVGFEPVLSNYLRLRENLTLNGLGKVARIYQAGLSDHVGEATITLREDFAAGATTGNAAIVTSMARDAGFATTNVQLMRLDDLAQEFASHQRPIAAIKLDIEGHEDAFLRGGRATIESFRPLILMEINRGYYNARNLDLNVLFMQLLPVGYGIYANRKGWKRIPSFEECYYMEDIYLVPLERLRTKGFHFFCD